MIKKGTDSWNIAFRKGEAGDILSNRKSTFTVIPNGVTYWVADPFVVNVNSSIFIFAELYSYWNLKGCIAVTELKSGKVGQWKVVIKEPFHMSYPFVFYHRNDIYMIPETNGADALRLYQAVEFPYKWRFVKNIISNVKWVDTTLFYENDVLYGYTRAHNDPDVDLKIAFDDDLCIVDVKEIKREKGDLSYRCGGNIFFVDSEMIRPCQNESDGYGCGLIFRYYNRSEQTEKHSVNVFPQEICTDTNVNWLGIHTYSADGGYEVIDLKSERHNYLEDIMIRWKRFIRRVKRRRNQFIQKAR